ncbi:MAG: mannose-1-phosphate guanylyltransferase/mannose-6-phosphate isomerase [Sulfuricellaceae bacterium]|nr:mannose-1-phosphate guanylyltransferase/mannose-6-phosphate isomerase [Sulfuricellaceae bacterium]
MVLPADHLINDQTAFAGAVAKARILALQEKLVTFGIMPSVPETGFGYVECGPACGAEAFQVASFVEKPAFEVAQQYVASSKYLWNSGMFCFKAGVFLRELETYAPVIYQGAMHCWQKTKAEIDPAARMIEFDQESFNQLPELSIDYAVMEKSKKVAVVAGRFDWSDIGSWDAVGDLIRPDEAGNSVIGEAVLVDVRNTLIHAGARMVAAVGVENLVIVDTPDALLVADRSRTQDVRKVVQQLKLLQHESYKTHRQVMRPWGSYTLLEEGSGFKIKRIEVKPGGALSLQMHCHRSEHWIVVSGTAKVTNGEKSYLVNTNESTFIPAGHRHRLENPGQLDLIMIEVQSGAYLGEDDIVRFEDNYGRS